MDFSEILEDIQQTTSEEINYPPPPYMEEEDFQVKFSVTLRSVTNERLKYKHKMSLHYATIVEKTFDIFEFFPEQILRMMKLDVQVIRKIIRPQIRRLRNNLLIFAGAAN
ncbi:4635_t:CDS:2 [Rhizophagus irregularis]|nr:4635_t:CDS:2 [Rhizophagus irregularis]